MVTTAADYKPSEGTKPSGRSGPYSLGCPAHELYEYLSRDRQPVIDKGRALAAITIPSVFPPDGYKTGDDIGEKNQSINALCVNTLASKLQFMAFPPDRPVLRYEPIEHKLRTELEQNPRMATEIQIGLSRLEQEHKNRLETTSIRTAYVGAIKVHLIAGNTCWEHQKLDSPVYHLPTNYVVKRNAVGEQLFVILKRCVNVIDLDEDVQEMILAVKPELKDQKEYERKADIYAVCRRVREDHYNVKSDPTKAYYWEYWEEFEGEVIPDSEVDTDYDKPILYAAWMIPVYGQDWGRSYCEEYEGDLLLVEGHSASLNDGSSIASLLWLFLKPGSRTSARQLKKANNLTVMAGVSEDITAGPDLSNKARDFQFVSSNLEAAARRLGRAFLNVGSIQRDAERVTAEEFSRMAMELDQATGGLYSEIAQTTQRHVVRRAVALHYEEDKELPKLPDGVFRVAVVTGLEAMGRTVAGRDLMETTGQMMETSGGAVATYIDWHDFTRRGYMHRGVPQDGLVRTPEAQAEFEENRKQEAMNQAMVEKGTGPAINALGKGAMPIIESQVAAQQPSNEPQGAPTE